MNIIKEYFKYITKKYDIDWTVEFVKWTSTIILVSILICGIKAMDSYSRKNQEEYERTVRFQIEVVDKYDCIGSNWHLVGGRASEQEYHIIYKVTPITPEAKKHYLGHGEDVDDDVPYTIYRKVKVGQKFIGTRQSISSYSF